ncbi:STAS/SEC14 domain-containing protein [Martelella radicis]|uniref:STAS/SEC14 domain-containing protein n=1 Tax=Martelella radicis TaxID=1397476 RepID=A0A7W6PB02_9HYPH|nr:STAS/SEC14 domain-containing protein [Martelella radicis]MBB4123385.1 hypothetical protein [Martelella radicis]
MIRMMNDLPANIVGWTMSGKVTAEDYETILIPALESRLGKGKIRCLIATSDDLEGVEARAMWDDTKFGLGHFFDFERIAFVTGDHALARIAHMFGVLIPAKVKLFQPEAIDEARRWVAA